MATVVVKMPGGDIEYVEVGDLLWMREAFDHEFKDAVMMRLTGDRMYSVEKLDELQAKFQQAGAAVARFTPPEGGIAMLVNADKVREIEPANSAISHENAGSVLKFGQKLRLAVREDELQARAILAGAKPASGVNVAAVVSGAVVGALAGAVAGAVLPAGSEPKP